MNYFTTTRDYSRKSGKSFDNRITYVSLSDAQNVLDSFRTYSNGKTIINISHMNLVRIQSENPYFDINYNPNPDGLLNDSRLYRIMFRGTAGDKILFNKYVDEIANLYLEYFNKAVHKEDMQLKPVNVNNPEPGNPEPGYGGYLKRRNRRTKSRRTKSRRTKSRRTKSRRTHCS
jgi:hypothetical protein